MVLLALGVIAYARRKHFLQRDGLSEVFRRHPLEESAFRDGRRDLLLMLLCYEDRYPSFAKILEKIAPHFPLTHLVPQPQFRRAINELREISQHGSHTVAARTNEHAALATIVRLVIDDPAIGRIYGRDLEPLVDEFLQQLQDTP